MSAPAATINPMSVDEQRLRNPTVAPTATRPAFVRLAGPGDEEVLDGLRNQAFDDLREARGGAMYLERHAAELPVLLTDWSGETRRVWLGGLENVELGYLIAAIVALPSGAMLGVIEGVYVEPDARGCGIGELMTSVAIDWFRSYGCVGVEATALPGERATKNFFEEHGLKARLLTVYRSLDDEENETD
jgi:GNAT superfamily N-acetyltransferase